MQHLYNEENRIKIDSLIRGQAKAKALPNDPHGAMRTPKTDWRAQWIWSKNDPSMKNIWTCFRKVVTLEKEPKKVTLSIAVDSRYWLWINGELVVFEGGCKRGPTPTDGYYDTVDLSGYLKKGDNVLAVLVWYWGSDTSFSNTDSGAAGLLFEAIGDGVEILSDSSFKCTLHKAYLDDDEDHAPNYRLPESNVLFDARKDIGAWQEINYDDSLWKNATEYGIGGCAPWNNLYERPIPLLKDYGLCDYIDSDKWIGYTTQEPTEITVKIPTNVQFTPYLKVEAKAGQHIRVTTENTSIGSINNAYITKDGMQEIELLSWMNGHSITYAFPAGVTIHSLQYRRSGYDTQFAGSFVCDDPYLNKLFVMAVDTLYVTMRDNFMDCPDRERAQWWADVTSEMAIMMYALSPDAYALYIKGVYTMLNYVDPATSVLQTVVPVSNQIFELPLQQLCGINGFLIYYQYTGDKQLLADVYKAAKDYVNLWTLGEDGLAHREGTWPWPDWGVDADMVALENAWCYLAMKDLKEIASILELRGEDDFYNSRMAAIYDTFQEFATPEGYMSPTVTHPDDRANAMAVLAGLCPESHYGEVLRCLNTYYNASPYMERYIADALCEMGMVDVAVERMKKRYQTMMDSGYPTLWEYFHWVDGGSLNHAWSSGPILTMSRYMAGIEPIEAGYSVYAIAPNLLHLTEADCVVPSIRGDIRVSYRVSKDVFSMTLTSPCDTEAKIALPALSGEASTLEINGEIVYQNGAVCTGKEDRCAGFADGRIHFTLQPGEYQITVR